MYFNSTCPFLDWLNVHIFNMIRLQFCLKYFLCNLDLFKNSSPTSMSSRFLPNFLYGRVRFSGLIFISLINFHFNLVHGDGNGSSFSFQHVERHFSHYLFNKEVIFLPVNMLNKFTKDKMAEFVSRCVCIFQTIPLILRSVFCYCPTDFITVVL